MPSLRHLLYCSRNCIAGTPQQVQEEIQSILAKSRTNNMAAEITGALLFDGKAFTQVLEGPADAIEETFERLQCDPRHSDVTLLENRLIDERHFTAWSMAFADPSVVQALPGANQTVAEAFSAPSSAASDVIKLLHRLILDKKDWLPRAEYAMQASR